MQRNNLVKIARCLRLDGMGAYRVIMMEYAEQINQLQEQVEELQRLAGDRGQEAGVRGQETEIVGDLGHGWKIERRWQSIPDGTATVDDGEMSGADELTDVGLTYRELAGQLRSA